MLSYNEAREKLYTAVLNSNSGDMSENSSRFQYDYLVITDHDVTSEDICSHGSIVLGLPRIGSYSPGSSRKVTSVSVSRWDDANMKAVPSHKLPIKGVGSYAAWKYEVTCQSEENQALGAKGKPNNTPKTVEEAKKIAKKRLACNVTRSFKSYTKTVDPAFISDPFPRTGKANPTAPYRSYSLPTGTTVSAEKEYFNTVWNFTYYTEKDLQNVQPLIGTLSSVDSICGVNLEGAQLRLNALTTTLIVQDVYKSDGSFSKQEQVYEHQVEIEVGEFNPMCIWADTSARLPEDPGPDSDPKYCPICELVHGSKTFDIIYNDPRYQYLFFDKPRLLGAFEGRQVDLSGTPYRLQSGIDYNYISESKVLTNRGFYYDTNLWTSADIGKYQLLLYSSVNWSPLQLPEGMATVYTNDTYEEDPKDFIKHNT